MNLKISLLCASLIFPVGAFASFPVPDALEQALGSASAGDVIALGFSSTLGIRAVNASPNRLTASGGTLIYSDDPETVEGFGILYQDELPAGHHRVYLYHTNGLSQTARFSIIAENMGPSQATVTPLAWSFPAPSGNYVQVGREGVRQFYENTTLPSAVTIAPGAAGVLAPALDSAVLSRDQLAAAILDYESDQPLRISTIMFDSHLTALGSFPALGFSTNDGNNRQGTFPMFARSEAGGIPYAYQFAEGIVKLRIGDGSSNQTDPPAAGVDAENGDAAVTLKGNYGVTYDVRLALQNDTGQHLAVLLNPRGGDYGGYFRVTLNQGPPIGQMVPKSSLAVPPTTSAGVVALLDVPRGASTLRLETIPAGASSLAIELLLVPYGEPAPMSSMWMLRGE